MLCEVDFFKTKAAQLAGVVEHTDCISVYDIKQCDGDAPVMLDLLGILSTPSLASLPDPLWPRVVAPDRVPLMGLIELFNINAENKWLMLNWIAWNSYLTLCKQIVVF